MLKGRRGRWAASKFALAAGCVGVLLHVASALGLRATPLAAPLPIAIPSELFMATSIGLIIDLFRPIRSRWSAMMVGFVATLPASALGWFLFRPPNASVQVALEAVLLGGLMMGCVGGAIIWDPHDADAEQV